MLSDLGKLKSKIGLEIFTVTAIVEFIAIIVVSVFIQLDANSGTPEIGEMVWLFAKMLIFFAVAGILSVFGLPHFFRLIKNHLSILGNKNYEELKKNLKCSELELADVVSLIKNLNPKPGLIFQKTDRTSYIAADVFVKKEGSQWITTLNEDNHIKLKLEENSQNLLSNSLEQDLKEKFQEAKSKVGSFFLVSKTMNV